MRRALGLAAALLAPAFATPTSAQRPADAALAKQLDAYTAQAFRDWDGVGLAISVVKDGRLVFAKGYGVRELEKPGAGRLRDAVRHRVHDQGDDRRRHWHARGRGQGQMGRPRHQLPAGLPAQRPVRHARGHRPRPAHASRRPAERGLPLVRQLELDGGDPPTRAPRRAGVFAALELHLSERHVCGGRPGHRVGERACRGRSSSGRESSSRCTWTGRCRSWRGTRGVPNVASPHDRIDDTLRVITNASVDPVASAGSVWSSVTDMSKWMRFVLDSGRVDGRALLKPATFARAAQAADDGAAGPVLPDVHG